MAKHKQHHARRVPKAHHSKPYRRRHLALLLFLLALVIVIAIEIGIVIGRNQRTAAPAADTGQHQSAAPSLRQVRSDYGYSFAVDGDNFDIVSTDHSATVKPKSGRVIGPVAAAQFSIDVNPDTKQLLAARAKPENTGLSAQQVAAQLFPVASTSTLAVSIISSGPDTLNAVPVYKTVYEFTSRKSGGKSYAVVWSGASKDRAFAVKLNGLVGSTSIPTAFAPIFASLNISADQAVLGASTSAFATPSAAASQKLDTKYLSDAVSPSVVQIFHSVCGVLTINGERLGDSGCISVSGSGFLATANGYIATNGHVVVYSAKDAVATLVTANESVLKSYLKSLGLSDAEISTTESDPAALATMVSKIYDIPDDQLKFSDKGELTLVALGSEQPDIKQLINLKSSADLAKFRQDSDTIKQAEVIASDYSAKDSYTTIADPKNGFSSSDVALLKINVTKAPAIPIATDKVVQNQKIIVMGFPGDAGNPLVDNTESDVTVTDGVVSSIRQAAGGKGKLYQSDADASHGNSGGPAIDDQGRVIGLLTYRYANSEPGNAAKSYIRDITDFTNLASANDVKLDSHSTTQDLWLRGLELYSHDHYSAALKNFQAVAEAYPAHRLADSYITSSRDAIAAGKDVKDFPIDVLVIILVAALAGLGTTVVVIARHHGLHKVYQLSQETAQPVPPLPMPLPAAGPVVTPTPAPPKLVQ